MMNQLPPGNAYTTKLLRFLTSNKRYSYEAVSNAGDTAVGLVAPRLAGLGAPVMAPERRVHRAYGATPKANTVSERYSCPGRRMVEGNPGWFGESGKCCVSRQKPDRWPYTCPPFPMIVPSRKLPE